MFKMFRPGTNGYINPKLFHKCWLRIFRDQGISCITDGFCEADYHRNINLLKFLADLICPKTTINIRK